MPGYQDRSVPASTAVGAKHHRIGPGVNVSGLAYVAKALPCGARERLAGLPGRRRRRYLLAGNTGKNGYVSGFLSPW